MSLIHHFFAVDSLSEKIFCWDLILIYFALKFLHDGFLSVLRASLWDQIQQHTMSKIEVELFSHLHNLSLRWHLSRKTGEVISIIDRGSYSIPALTDFLIFTTIPAFIDVFVGVTFFLVTFSWYFDVIFFVTMILYIVDK